MPRKIKRIYRSDNDKVIAGVCGGIAEHYSIDPLWVRLLVLLLAMLDGIGVAIYLVAWALLPKNPAHERRKRTHAEKLLQYVIDQLRGRTQTISHYDENIRVAEIMVGALLIFIGVAFLIKNLFDWFSLRYIWIITIAITGILLLMRRR